jgi:protein transport protein SEC31
VSRCYLAQGRKERSRRSFNAGPRLVCLSGRFNRLAWSAPSASHEKGFIAAGMETGEVNVYDPVKIMSGAR